MNLFSLPEENDRHPARYYERCLEYPEHQHLKDGEPKVAFLLRNFIKTDAGRTVLGSAHLPGVQGKLKEMFDWMVEGLFGYMPDFLIIIDATYWNAADDRQREILMFHEMAHCVHQTDQYGDLKFTREGLPVWGIAGHDVEEFTSVVARYGAWSAELSDFIEAANAHKPSDSEKAG